MVLPVNRALDDVIDHADINAIATAVNARAGQTYPHLWASSALNATIQADFNAGYIAIGQVIATAAYHSGSTVGGATYLVVASATGTVDGGSFIDGTGFQLQAVFGEAVNVSQFGAKGDGATDATSAIQAALNQLNSGTTVWFPAGTFNISTALTLPDSTTEGAGTIAGAGADVSIIQNTGTGNAFTLVGGISGPIGINRLYMHDLTIAGTASSDYGLYADIIYHCTFERVHFRDNGEDGAFIKRAIYNKFRDCEFRDNVGNGLTLGETANDTTVMSCYSTLNGQNGIFIDWGGVDTQGTHGISVIGGAIESNTGQGVLIRGCHDIRLFSVYFESNEPTSYHIQMVQATAGTPVKNVEHVIIRDCNFGGSNKSLSFGDTTSCMLAGNSINNTVDITAQTTGLIVLPQALVAVPFNDYGVGTRYVMGELDTLAGQWGSDTASGSADWDSWTDEGVNARLMGGADTNGPGGSGLLFHCMNIIYDASGSNTITQLAIPYGYPSSTAEGISFRGRYSGTWNGWVNPLGGSATRQTGYTTTPNLTTDRTIADADASSVAELADVLGTLIEDLKTAGVIEA